MSITRRNVLKMLMASPISALAASPPSTSMALIRPAQTQISSLTCGVFPVFDAVCDGGMSTGATPAVNTAALEDATKIDPANPLANPGLRVYIPAGIYNLECEADKVNIDNDIIIVGEGVEQTILNFVPDNPSTTGVGFQVSNGARVIFQNLTIQGPSAYTGVIGAQGIRIEEAGTVILERCKVIRWTTCIKGQGSGAETGPMNIEAHHCEFQAEAQGIQTTVKNFHGYCHVFNSLFRDNGTFEGGGSFNHDFYISQSTSLKIIGCRFDMTVVGGGGGIAHGGGDNGLAQYSIVEGCSFFKTDGNGGWAFENNGISDTLKSLVSNCSFHRASCGVGNSNGLELSNCYFYGEGRSIGVIGMAGKPNGDVSISNCHFVECTLAFVPAGSDGITWQIYNCTVRGGDDSDYVIYCNKSENIDILIDGLVVRGALQANNPLRFEKGRNFTLRNIDIELTTRPNAITAINPEVSTGEWTGRVWLENYRHADNTGKGTLNTRKDIHGRQIDLGGDHIEINSTTAVAYVRPTEAIHTTDLASASTLVLGAGDKNKFKVTGSAVIDIIDLPSGHNRALEGVFFFEVATAASWSLSNTGNIVPKSTSARNAGEMVGLYHDAANHVWREV